MCFGNLMKQLVFMLVLSLSASCWAALHGIPDDCLLTSIFGKPIPLGSKSEYSLTADMCRAAWRIRGHVDRFARIRLKLEKGIPVIIAPFGGSVSCGRNLTPSNARPDRLCTDYNRGTQVYIECKHEAYPAMLQQALNELYPAKSNNCTEPGRHEKKNLTGCHRVLNFCHPGMGSDKVVSSVVKEHKTLLQADLVIVETTRNDIKELLQTHNSSQDAIGHYTEILVRQLLWLKNEPAIIYLHAAWRFGTPPAEVAPFHTNAAEQHRHVLDYYNIPQVSMMAIFQPLYSTEQREWIRNVYFNDCCHPSRLGHMMIASVLVFVLRQAMASYTAFHGFIREGISKGMHYLPSDIPVLTDVPLTSCTAMNNRPLKAKLLSTWISPKTLVQKQ